MEILAIYLANSLTMETAYMYHKNRYSEKVPWYVPKQKRATVYRFYRPPLKISYKMSENITFKCTKPLHNLLLPQYMELCMYHEPRHEKTRFLPMRKNKDPDQLCSNSYCTADQRLCFHYWDGAIPLLVISDISSF